MSGFPGEQARWIEDSQDRVEEHQAAKAAEARRAAAEERAVLAFQASQALRGQHVSVGEVLDGQLGVTVGSVLDRSRLAVDGPDVKPDEVFYGEPVIRGKFRDVPDVIARASLAAEERALERRESDAYVALETAKARRTPATLGGAWARWRAR